MTSRHVLSLAAGLLVLAASTVANVSVPLTLGVSGDRLTVNGEPRFLVIVSYFDALDAKSLDADLGALARSVDGIRIFANWWDVTPEGKCRHAFTDRTLFEQTEAGAIRLRPERLARLQDVLRSARRHGLVVDLTFASEPVRGTSRLTETVNKDGRACPEPGFRNVVDWAAVAPAFGEAAAALAADEFDHVFFDLQNEAGHALNMARDADLARLVSAVREKDPKRLLTVSSDSRNAEEQAARVRALKLSILTFHGERGEGWGKRTAGEVRKFHAALARAGTPVPIYVGEPDPLDHGRGDREFRESVTGARQAGAAAWTLHTRAGFQLDDQPLGDRLDPVTRQVLDALPRWLGR
jgi:hypothetical protein